jgi:hypothetical protein
MGVAALLIQAVLRLGVLAVEPILARTLSPAQVALYVVWVGISAYFEGYRAFHLRFCPRVVGRALHLARNPRVLHVVLAPLFCMGFFHANRRTLLLAWGTTAMVIGFIVTLRYVPQPWRGIVDGGVVVALSGGVVSLGVLLVRGLRGTRFEDAAGLPEGS